jgi:PKD repeat protein
MKKIIFSIIIFSLSVLSYAVIQTAWEETFGGTNSDACNSVCIAPDNGYLLVGYTNSYGADRSDIYLIKTDDNGTEEWTQSYGGTGWKNANDVCVSNNNDGFVITGYSTENGNFDVFCMKVDLSGNQVWYVTVGGDDFDTAESICQITNGGYLLCGYTASYGLGEDDIYVIKIDDSGSVIWEETYGCTKSDTAHSIKQTSDGNYVLCGSTGLYDLPFPGSSGRNREIYIIKLDGDGNILLENTYWTMGTHQNDYDVGFDICETSDGGFCVVGHTSQHLNELMDVAFIKVDSNLNELWKTNLELDVYYDFGYSILEDINSENLILCGSFKYTNSRFSEMFMMILDSNGNEIENTLIGDNGSECGNSMLQKADGSIVIAGYTSSNGTGKNDAWLLELVNLSAEFDADQKSGHAPLQIQFEDQSSGMIDTWSWDFDNDGIPDSNEQNPIWSYTEPGYYDVQLTVSFGGVDDAMLNEDYIRVFDGHSALEFDGDDSNVTCLSGDVPELTNAFTMEAWIYPTDFGPDVNFGLGRIFDKTVVSVFLNNTFPLYPEQSLILQIEHEDGTISTSTTPEISIDLYQWQHIAVCYDGVDNVNMYINGISMMTIQTTAPVGAVADNSDYDLILGNSADLTKSFVGVIDELRVWNVFRDQAEIQEVLLEYLNGYEPGLISYCRLNEGFGEFVLDEVSTIELPLCDIRWAQGFFLAPAHSEILLSPEKPSLSAYPNPFNPSTTIEFSLVNNEKIEISVFNIMGQKITTLVDEKLDIGNHQITWNGSDEYGKKLASGIYLYKMKSSSYQLTKKIILLK